MARLRRGAMSRVLHRAVARRLLPRDEDDRSRWGSWLSIIRRVVPAWVDHADWFAIPPLGDGFQV